MVRWHYDNIEISLRSKEEEKVFAEKFYIAEAKLLDIEAGKPIVMLNESEAKENGIYHGSRVLIRKGNKEAVGIVNLSSKFVKRGQIGFFKEFEKILEIKDKDLVEISPMAYPMSIEAIIKKINNGKLTDSEIENCIRDIVDNKLSEAEIAAFLVACHINGLDDDEITSLTNAMVESGGKISFESKYVADKHCIGGVAANRTTMVIVPIIAACGIYIPKTSSRAITSPAGTADTMEVLCPVEFSLEELERMVKKVYGAIVWGGGVNIAPADDKMINIRRPLRLDPLGVMMASILAKKKAVGSKYLIIDIPVGKGAKIEDNERAKFLANKFKAITKRLGITTNVLITDGSQPIGRGIGPALEARDVLSVLEGNGPIDLYEKSIIMAGTLLEMVGKAKEGEGAKMAEEIIKSGKALKKMREIIENQGGNPNIKKEDIHIGDCSYDIVSERDGKIEWIDNKNVSRIARIAGAPTDKGAGVYLWKVKGDYVKKGEKLMTIYAHTETKLTLAIEAAQKFNPFSFEKILLTRV